MSFDPILTQLIFLFLTAMLAGLVCLFLIWRLEKLPSKQRDALLQFAEIAVKCVAQSMPELSSDAKLSAAVSLVDRLLDKFDHDPVEHDIIRAVVESAYADFKAFFKKPQTTQPLNVVVPPQAQSRIQGVHNEF